MNRTAVVSLAAAAVLGTTGGITLALSTVGSGDEDPPAGRSSEPGSTPTDDGPSGKGSTDLVPLYYADGAIHDGARNAAVPAQVASGTISSLAEVDGGWLVVNVDSDTSGDPIFTGTFVPESGEAWRIGEWRGHPDISAERDRVVFGNGVSWRVATFADRTTEPLDVIDGPGEEPPFIDVVNSLPGVAIGAGGLVTGWTAGDSTRLVETEQDGWTHQDWGPRGVDVPLTSPDGSQAVAAYRNADYAPETPVGDCLTGGPSDDAGSWWKECEVGPASLEPWSPSGKRLLLTGTTGDGPGPSWVRVVDPATGEKESEFDPTGLLAGATWADDTTVFTLTLDDRTLAATIKRCDTRAERCEDVKRVPDTAVLGTRG